MQNIVELKRVAFKAIEDRKRFVGNGCDNNLANPRAHGQSIVCIKGSGNNCPVTVTVDGAWKRNKKKARIDEAIGWSVAADGRIVGEGAARVFSCNTLATEALAVGTTARNYRSKTKRFYG